MTGTDPSPFWNKLRTLWVSRPSWLTQGHYMRHMKAITLTPDEQSVARLRINMNTQEVEAPPGVGGGPCVVYQGNWGDGKGYKKIRWQGGTMYVHRLAYAAAHGHADGENVLDHKCRNRGCCNPRHLEPVSVKVNTLRGNGKWIFEQGYVPKVVEAAE